jgi:hypothetical protein
MLGSSKPTRLPSNRLDPDRVKIVPGRRHEERRPLRLGPVDGSLWDNSSSTH